MNNQSTIAGEDTFTIENVEQYMGKKDFKELVVQCRKHKKFIKEFQKMKWLNQIHQGGEVVVIQRQTMTNKMIQQIVRIKTILCIQGFADDQQLPLVEVQFFLGKDELSNKIKEDYSDCFSDNELFLSPEIDVFFVDVIQQKCQVVTLDEYEQLSPPKPYLYFSRSEYDKQTKMIEPPLDIWNKTCICYQPLNPDRAYIFCESCKEWFHMDCVNITQYEAENLDEYTCKECIQQNNGQL